MMMLQSLTQIKVRHQNKKIKKLARKYQSWACHSI